MDFRWNWDIYTLRGCDGLELVYEQSQSPIVCEGIWACGGTHILRIVGRGICHLRTADSVGSDSALIVNPVFVALQAM